MALADTGPTCAADLADVRPMRVDDLAFAAALHETALPHGFFGRLGTGFLLAYYESFLASPHAVAFVAEGAGVPSGMLVGTIRNRAHYNWVLSRRGRTLAVRGALALLRRPGQLALFLRTRAVWYLGALLRFVGVARPAAAGRQRRRGDSGRQPAVLTHVAVTPFARSAGAGGTLVASFLDAAREAGCRDAVLVTLAGPDGAGGFYRRLGWSLRDTHDDRDGRLLECYHRRL